MKVHIDSRMVSWRLPIVLHGMQLFCSVSQAVRSISVKYSALTKVKLEKCAALEYKGGVHHATPRPV